MNAIVLCEGETDKIILECVFSSKFGYKNDKEETKKNGGEAFFYKNSKHKLCINPVDGHDFRIKFNEILINNERNTDTFYDCIIIIADHDSEKETSRLKDEIKSTMEQNNIKLNDELKCNKWIEVNQNIEFNESKKIELIFIPLPLDAEGALETFLMKCLRKQNEYLVDESNKFVKCLIENHDKFSNEYLEKRRDKVKAPLAVYLGVTIPEKSFLKEKEMFKEVPWENYIDVSDGLEKLKKLSDD